MRDKVLLVMKEHVWLAGIIAGVMLWLFQTFATLSAVAEKEVSVRTYVDEKHRGVENRLDEQKTILERIDARVYELNQRYK